MSNIIKGTSALTIDVKAGLIYAIEYNKVSSINVVNYTDGVIYVSENDNFNKDENGVGQYLVITDGNCYNEYIFYKNGINTIYIKSDTDGQVCIVRKQW